MRVGFSSDPYRAVSTSLRRDLNAVLAAQDRVLIAGCVLDAANRRGLSGVYH
jgi:hypothetical protein